MAHVLHRIESHYVSVHSLCYLALDAVEGTAADEEYIACIYVDIVLVGMLTASLRGHVHHCSLKQLEQSLLHTLAAYVACDAGVVGLACYLVDLVDEHYASFGSRYVVVGHLQQTREYALHVLTYIACLGEYRCIYDGEWHLEQLGNGSCKESLARSGRAYHYDVALFYLHSVVVLRLLQTLVVVVDSHREIFLGFVLSYYILVEIVLDFHRLGYIAHRYVKFRLALALAAGSHARLAHYLICLLRTLVADESVESGYKEVDILLCSSAEATYFSWHRYFLLLSCNWCHFAGSI